MARRCRKGKSLLGTCVIVAALTNLLCLLYVAWVARYLQGQHPVAERPPEKQRSEDRWLEERLRRLEVLVRQHLEESRQDPEEQMDPETFSDSPLFAQWGRHLSPEARRVAWKKFQYYGYNGYLSDQLPLDRPIPDLRPDGCRNLSYPSDLPQISVVFIFVNEASSVILRSMHSVISKTPAHLLKEIVLIDDNSDNGALWRDLGAFVEEVNGHRQGFIKVVRHARREGLIRSRISGWRAATAPVVALFDAHVEFSDQWAEPILSRIKADRRRVISPSFDNIKYDNFEVEEYSLSAQGFDWELWCRYLSPPKEWWALNNATAPIRSPSLIGCFVVDRQFFEEIGLLDEGMEVYGGENVELSIRVWQCGGSVEVLPCSRLAHIERAHKPYTEDLTAHVRRNALRVAEVWMDEFKGHVYMAWNIPRESSGIDIGDISERKALRQRLRCKSFRWYLNNVYTQMRRYTDMLAYGTAIYYMSSQQIHVGALSPTLDAADNRCLVEVNGQPRLIECGYAESKQMQLHWLFTQGGPVQNKVSRKCLEIEERSDSVYEYQLSLQKCSGQHWTISNILRKMNLQ
ncbi:polypeptide N-acetylgalactosaminyltransferase 18-like isoform X2 [Narcine bancroftii]|uniref:polypeptide N-acetylgalactosaminyltransferase 18-like isoform X2 n=1 Tax=Narcine bancroftii TaxID=1343680 RepID=UPI0038315B10